MQRLRWQAKEVGQEESEEGMSKSAIFGLCVSLLILFVAVPYLMVDQKVKAHDRGYAEGYAAALKEGGKIIGNLPACDSNDNLITIYGVSACDPSLNIDSQVYVAVCCFDSARVSPNKIEVWPNVTEFKIRVMKDKIRRLTEFLSDTIPVAQLKTAMKRLPKIGRDSSWRVDDTIPPVIWNLDEKYYYGGH